MTTYFKRLKHHPGLPVATGLTLLGMIAGISNESFETWWHGALFGAIGLGIPTFLIVLVSNYRKKLKP